MTEIQESLSRNMKEARKMHGLSQMKLAEACSVSTSYIGEIEIGRKFPSASTLQKIADALHLRPYQLFLDKGDGKEFDRVDVVKRLYEELKDKINKDLEQIISGYLS